MKSMYCTRCESVGRKSSHNARNIVLGPNGLRMVVCDQCLDEINDEDTVYVKHEVEENEGASREDS